MRMPIVVSALLVLAIGTASGAGRGLIDPDVAYSATRIMEAQGQRIEQRYYQRSAGMNRADTELQGQQSSMIVRMDKNLVWMVAPQQRMVMEMSLMDPKARERMAKIPDNETITEYEILGSEDVNGVAADKYRVVARDADGSRVEGFFWISKDDRIPVKMDLAEGGDRAVMELKDLKVGAQPDSLFEPPAGYRRVAFGGGMSGLAGMVSGKTATAAQAPAAASPPDANSPSADPAGQPPGAAEEFAGDLTNAAVDEAKRTTTDEVRETVKDGLKKLFGR